MNTIFSFTKPSASNSPATVILTPDQKAHIFAYQYSKNNTSSSPQTYKVQVKEITGSNLDISVGTNTIANRAATMLHGTYDAFLELDNAGTYEIYLRDSSGNPLNGVPTICNMQTTRTNVDRFITYIEYQINDNNGVVIIVMNNIL